MKACLFAVVLCVITSCTRNSKSEKDKVISDTIVKSTGTPQTAAAKTIDDIRSVDDIRREYAAIEANIASGNLDSTSFKYNCYNEKNGTVTYFFEGKNLRMIRHVYNEYDHHSAKDYYYLKDDSLIFVFYDRLSWSFDSNADVQDATKDDIVESRYYIVDNKPISCLQKKFTIRSSSSRNPDSKTVVSKKVNCSSLAPVYTKLKLLSKFKNNTKDTTCLERS